MAKIVIDGQFAIPSGTASTALTLDGSKNIVSSSTTSTELGYVHGVTSAIQTQLDNKVESVTAENSTIVVDNTDAANPTITVGIITPNFVQDAANPYTIMQLNDVGVMQSYALTPGQALGADSNGLVASLSAANAEVNTLVGIDTGTTIQDQLDALATPGFDDITSGTNTTAAMIVGNGASLAATGSGTIHATSSDTLATGRTIAISGDLTYTSPSFNGSGNVTAAGTLATVNSNVGSFGSSSSIPSFTVNGKGLITAASGNSVVAPAGTLTGTTLASNVVTSSLTSVGSQAQALDMNTHQINNVTDPSNAQDAATKNYVDMAINGLSPKNSVRLATTSALAANTYNNGSSGVGATLTGDSTGILTIDGQTVNLNDRLWIKNESTDANNGLYICTTAGAIGVAYVLTRTSDADTSAELIGAYAYVEAGTINATTTWAISNTSTITLGSTSITLAQISGPGTYTAGTGLNLSGNQFSIDSTVATLTGSQALTNKTYNGLTVTSTTGSVTIADGKTLSSNNTLTFAGTDGSTLNVGTGGTLGTAAFQNTGTSGSTIPFLNAANTWSGVQSINSGNLALKGATSGTIILNAAATAGSNTITLPAGTTDFSTTGGTSQVVKQTSAGGAFTVAQLTPSDLANIGTGVATALAVDVGTAGSPVVNGGALGTPSSGTATNLTGTASGLTSGAATTLSTPRAIYGNNFDGSAALTQVIASTYGGTGNGFAKLSGPTTSEKTFTLPNASATILTDNAAVTVAQGGTGLTTLTTAYGVVCAGTTATGALQNAGAGSPGQVLTSNGSSALPSFQSLGVASGSVLQVVNTQTGSVATGTTVMPYDNTIPQNTEGDEYMSLSITPTNSSNKLRIDAICYVEGSVAGVNTAAIFQDSTANALIAGQSKSIVGVGSSGSITLTYYMTAGTTSATTFKLRAGLSTAGTLTFNGSNGTGLYGGVYISSMTITEIKA